MKTHYHTLGVEPEADQKEIKKAYFELAKKYHPDSNNSAEIQKFQQITEAYKTLTDVELRKEYNKTLDTGLDVIDKVESQLTPEPEPETNTPLTNRPSHREEALRIYHRNRFRRAVFRVVLTGVLFTAFGLFLTLILGGYLVVNGMVGGLIGMSLSMEKNFEVGSFFNTEKKRKGFKWLLRLFWWGGMSYFLLIFWTSLN